jgi:diguanylate cyclase (GGDEF)-like protein
MVNAQNNTPASREDYIIFLDTNPDVIESLTPTLKSAGYEILASNSLEEALSLCRKFRPKLLLPDISKPGASKRLLDFISQFQESTGENIGIVLITKNSVPECEELKGIRYVREPFLNDDLICAIREAEEIVLIKEERDMFLAQVTEYAKGLEKMVQEQTSELTNTNIMLRTLSITDDLTGVYNRRYFFERLEEEISQTIRYGHPLAAMIMDLDNFKNINDCMGHMVGDDVLREFASLIKRNLRKGETVARYGGEEFAVILPHVKGIEALKAAEIVRKTVESAEFSCSQEGINVTVSIGVAELDNEIKDADELIARADKALYEAKKQGKNKACIWPPP